MATLSDGLVRKLKDRGLRPSYHRIRVLEYLYERKDTHPTVDEIFDALSPEIPSLSKTTVYNTLHTFVQAGLARAVTIDPAQTRFDSTLANHGHFECDSCGAITNFPVNVDHLAIAGLDQFEITQKDVYFRGLCPKCRNPK
jgi:Fur family peroxide stress response transcriptional regulator